MEKGENIYIVHVSGTLEEGAKAFTNYPDARKYAKEWGDVIAGDAIAELADPSKVKKYITQNTKVENEEEPVTHMPFELHIAVDNYDEDYCEIKIFKEKLK